MAPNDPALLLSPQFPSAASTTLGDVATSFEQVAASLAAGTPSGNIRLVPVPGLGGEEDSGLFIFEERFFDEFTGTEIWQPKGIPFTAQDLPDAEGLTPSQKLANELAQLGIDAEQARIDVANRNATTSEAAQAESARANRAREAEAARQRALQASTNALSAYLTGTELADARRLKSFQEARALLPQLIDPSRKFFGGQEPGGFLDQFSQKFLGRPFEGARVVPKTFRPGELAKAPTPGQIGSEIVAGVADIRSKG